MAFLTCITRCDINDTTQCGSHCSSLGKVNESNEPICREVPGIGNQLRKLVLRTIKMHTLYPLNYDLMVSTRVLVYKGIYECYID